MDAIDHHHTGLGQLGQKSFAPDPLTATRGRRLCEKWAAGVKAALLDPEYHPLTVWCAGLGRPLVWRPGFVATPGGKPVHRGALSIHDPTIILPYGLFLPPSADGCGTLVLARGENMVMEHDDLLSTAAATSKFNGRAPNLIRASR